MWNLYFMIYFFILGSILGSFFNVISQRLHQGKNLILGRSQCDFCGHKLGVFDLIPFFSYILLNGKCRYCRQKLSYYYPFSEFLSGMMMVFVYLLYLKYYYDHKYLIFFFIIFSIFTIIIISDLKYFEIPFPLIVLGVILSLFYRIFILKNIDQTNIWFELLSLTLVFLFFSSVIILSKGGMGGGDLKLSLMISLVVGYQNTLQSIYLGFLMGGLFSILLLLGRKKSLKSKIPLGPFLILGTVLTMFFPDIISSILDGNFSWFMF